MNHKGFLVVEAPWGRKFWRESEDPSRGLIDVMILSYHL